MCRSVYASLLALIVGSCADWKPETPVATEGERVGVTVASLGLASTQDAIWDLRVRNNASPPETVFAIRLTASRYGDGTGSASYVGPCDASANDNVIELRLVGIYPSAVGSANDFGEAAPAGALEAQDPGLMSRTITCDANADVSVRFDVTVLRPAGQGFFDIALDFADVYCSAKYDCAAQNLLFDEQGQRGHTHVLGFACTAGPSAEPHTTLHLDDLILNCGDAGVAVIDPTGGPGNLCVAGQTDDCGPGVDDPESLLFQVAVYRGEEQLQGLDKRYWNVALGLRDSLGASFTPAGLYYTQQAGGDALVPFGRMSPDGTLTPIGPGLNFDTDSNREVTLINSPSGEVFGFNTMDCCGPRSWGRIDPTTGVFTKLGELTDEFDMMFGSFATPRLGFSGAGNLYVFGFIGSSTFKFGRFDTTTGTYTDILNPAPHDFAQSFAPGPGDTLYYTRQAGGTGLVPFGQLDADGSATPIGPGLDLGQDSNREVMLLTSPSGELYGFNLMDCCGPRSWGRIDPSTGEFTKLGELTDEFEMMPGSFAIPRLGFDRDGTLFAFGFIGSSTFKLGSLDTSTGAFTELLNPAPHDLAAAFATPAAIATPCSFSTRGTVDDGAKLGTPATIPAGVIYPYVFWNVALDDCPANFPLTFGEGAVTTVYTRTEDSASRSFAHAFGPSALPAVELVSATPTEGAIVNLESDARPAHTATFSRAVAIEGAIDDAIILSCAAVPIPVMVTLTSDGLSLEAMPMVDLPSGAKCTGALRAGAVVGVIGGAEVSAVPWTYTTTGNAFQILHSFSAGTSPRSGLAYADATLYGIQQKPVSVFSVATDGSGFTLLVDLEERGLGATFDASQGPIVVGDALYGTTTHGGVDGAGTVWRVGRDGQNFSFLHQFASADGQRPQGRLLLVGDELYGTTEDNSVFRLALDGTGFTVLHTFDGGLGGSGPVSELTYHEGLLYGTTRDGGSNDDGFGGAGGVIFSIALDGTGYTVLYDVDENVVARDAFSNLTILDGHLYSSLHGGGPYYGGAIFRLGFDGADFELLVQLGTGSGLTPPYPEGPYGGNFAWQGRLWGISSGSAFGSDGVSAIWSMAADGSDLTVEHEFSRLGWSEATNVMQPEVAPVNVNGTLFGMAVYGGAHDGGAVYRFQTR